MIIKYDFLCKLTGEVTEIEVNDELGKIVEEIEKDEFKNNRTETRRHNYISELEEQGYYIADDIDPLDDLLHAELHKELMAAIKQLKPQQQALLRRVYIDGETQEEISESEGVSQQAISSRLKTIYIFLKKILG